ncbi:Protein of unknown function [Halomonas shengliensis]|uniref:DUF3592 domain-containing protein n=1 Tax=Halomonas shengliensis TaxID=419597 RepID=A0A1H0K2R2_9GAMM|nr:DUF3592 domain-containing protein [Halomonas shengliensis]SDO50325.1 Protein of unknown function [Halomonas shengliensis]
MPELPLLIAIAALAGAAFSAYGVWRRRAVNAWPRATAEVVATEVIELGSRVQNREGPEQERRYLARVAVRFEVAGEAVATDNRRFDAAPSFRSREAAQAWLRDYPVGKALEVRHAPDDPRLAQFGPSRLPVRRIGLTLFLLAMAGFALFLHLKG